MASVPNVGIAPVNRLLVLLSHSDYERLRLHLHSAEMGYKKPLYDVSRKEFDRLLNGGMPR